MDVDEDRRGSVDEMEQEILSRPGFLMDGAHHTREYTTISMALFTLLRVLHGYETGEPLYQDLLRNNALFFVPVVNRDAHALISETFEKEGKFPMIRKNRHNYGDTETDTDKCSIGVDLNRNYGFEFAHDDVGSKVDPCNDNYRGPEPFSEPET